MHIFLQFDDFLLKKNQIYKRRKIREILYIFNLRKNVKNQCSQSTILTFRTVVELNHLSLQEVLLRQSL